MTYIRVNTYALNASYLTILSLYIIQQVFYAQCTCIHSSTHFVLWKLHELSISVWKQYFLIPGTCIHYCRQCSSNKLYCNPIWIVYVLFDLCMIYPVPITDIRYILDSIICRRSSDEYVKNEHGPKENEWTLMRYYK